MFRQHCKDDSGTLTKCEHSEISHKQANKSHLCHLTILTI